MNFRDGIDKFVNEYGTAKQQQFAKNSFGDFVRQEIPELIYQTGLVDNSKYLVTASVGQGTWAMVPWICIFDRSITTSATKGIYIVYLLSNDCSKLYLTFNQGCTDIRKSHGKNETIAIMRNKAEEIYNQIDSRGFKYDEDISLGNGLTELGILYQKGTIFYREYEQGSIPSEENLREDLSKMLEIYAEYKKVLVEGDEWWPSLKEYDPGITKEKWISILNDSNIIGPLRGGALAMFYDQGGSATCSELAEIYGRNAFGISGNCTQLAKQISKEISCPLLNEDGRIRYWPILFVGKKQGKDKAGTWIWKLRKELYDAIPESDILKYLPNKNGSHSYLITWNPLNYAYTEYEEMRDKVLNSEKYIDEWACANKNVNIGDRVYLMRTGTGKTNGIIASGYAASTSYMAPHYDSAKAAAGLEIPKIKVEFDYLADRNGGKYLKQELLKEKFPNQQWSPMGSGIQIKDEYKDELEEEWQKLINHQDDTPNENDDKVEEMFDEVSAKAAVQQIKSFIANSGFTYENGLVENFYLSLKSKPFVILAGTSGTGKTRLVKLFAKAISAEYKMVPVRPDWSDSTDLFGHLDLNGKYIKGEILPFIVKAKNDPDHSYILCLDEMNLARVEYYLSDFLSVIETRDFKDGHIVSESLVDDSRYGDDQQARSDYGEVQFPENLYLVGTVNMDETTFPFSKKVLDRANTIEFNNVDLTSFNTDTEETKELHLANSFLKTKYLLLSDCKDEEVFVRDINTELQKLNEILQRANAHVGYRVRDEIVFYMLNNKETGLLERDEAFDNEIMQKILPRIQGSSNSVKEMLCDLFKEFAGDYSGIQTGTGDTASLMLAKLNKNKARYPKSAEKIAFMVRRFEEDGFTSYWL